MKNKKRINPKLFVLIMCILLTLLSCCVILLILDSYEIKQPNKKEDNVTYVYKDIFLYKPYRSETKIEDLEIIPHSDELPMGGYYYYKEVDRYRNSSNQLVLDSFGPGDKIEFNLELTNRSRKDILLSVHFINGLDVTDDMFDYFEIESSLPLKEDGNYVWSLLKYSSTNKITKIHYSISIPITSNAYTNQFSLNIDVLTRTI